MDNYLRESLDIEKENSFMCKFHWKDEFDKELFAILIFEIRNLTKELCDNNEKGEIFIENLKMIFNFYNYLTDRILFHNIKDNLSKIKNYDDDILYIYHSRLEFVLKKFFDLDFKAMDEYEDELGTLDQW
jgi:hypothetical protein